MPTRIKHEFGLGASTAQRIIREQRARYVLLTAANWAQNVERITPEVAAVGFPNRDGKYRALTGDRMFDRSYFVLDGAGEVIEFRDEHGQMTRFLDGLHPESVFHGADENVTEYLERRYEGVVPVADVLAEGKRLLEGWPAFRTDDVDRVINTLDAIAADKADEY